MADIIGGDMKNPGRYTKYGVSVEIGHVKVQADFIYVVWLKPLIAEGKTTCTYVQHCNGFLLKGHGQTLCFPKDVPVSLPLVGLRGPV